MRARAKADDGLTLVEVVVAMLVLTLGIVSLIQTFDSARKLTLVAERRASIAHLAQREIERLQSVPYSELAMVTEPTKPTECAKKEWRNPDCYVGYSSPVKCTEIEAKGCFAWNAEKPSEEDALVVLQKEGKKCPTTGTTTEECGVISASPTGVSCSEINPFGACEWTDGRLSGAVYDFVTEHKDTSCTSCTSAAYKRVTVVVTVNVPTGAHKPAPVRVSTLIPNPAASKSNPLEGTGTKCVDKNGEEKSCTQGIDKGNARSWYLHDAEAEAVEKSSLEEAENNVQVESERAGHVTHATVEAPAKPDFMDSTAPARKVLYDYSTDQNSYGSTMSLESGLCNAQLLGGVCYGGRRIGKDVLCEKEPTKTDNTRGEFWVTVPVATTTKLTGAGGLTIYTQTVNGVAASVTLCVAAYDVPEQLEKLWSTTLTSPTLLGYASYGPVSWPTTMSSVGFVFSLTFPKNNQTVAEKHRIGFRIWPAETSTEAISVAYDTTSQPSVLQLNTE